MKRILARTGLGLLIFLVLLLAGVLLSPVQPDQNLVWDENATVTYELNESYLSNNFDSLNELYGYKKELPKGYEVQALLALSAYPELKDVKVKFEFSKTVTAPLEANFAIPTLILPRKNRKYRVIISSAEEGFMKDANFRNINFNGQVGILAHELGHVQYYDKCNLLQIGNWALGYIAKKDFANIHERETDKIVVHRGLGWQLLESTIFFNQYFGDGNPIDKSQKIKEYLDMKPPIPTQEGGRYLGIDGVFQEMINLEGYRKSFEEQVQEIEKD